SFPARRSSDLRFFPVTPEPVSDVFPMLSANGVSKINDTDAISDSFKSHSALLVGCLAVFVVVMAQIHVPTEEVLGPFIHPGLCTARTSDGVEAVLDENQGVQFALADDDWPCLPQLRYGVQHRLAVAGHVDHLRVDALWGWVVPANVDQ